MSEGQSKKLAAHLESYTYLYVKDIVAYVRATFEVAYSIPGMTHWLRRHCFSHKKPAVIPGKANLEKQQAWLAEYEKLRQGLPEDETIGFIDGVHPTHNVQSAYGWIKTGVRKEIPANTGRQRINLSGMIDVVGHNVIVQEDETLNAGATIQFFQKIEAAYPTKTRVHVFCDNAPYYRNKTVKQYLARVYKILLASCARFWRPVSYILRVVPCAVFHARYNSLDAKRLCKSPANIL